MSPRMSSRRREVRVSRLRFDGPGHDRIYPNSQGPAAMKSLAPHAVPPNDSEDPAEVVAGGSITAEMTLVK